MSKSIAILGAGVSGLIAALTLEKRGYSPIIFDSNESVGGRVISRSDKNYQLDLGFQVLLTAYPEVQKHLDLDKLNLREFKPGAILYKNKKGQKIGDPLRDGQALLPTILTSRLNIGDKLKIYQLSNKLKAKSIQDIFNDNKVTSTLTYLQDFGFSNKAIQNFFKPFFTGIFLETELNTPSSMFEFVFKMFSEGSAAIPQNGISEVSQQIKSKLKHTTFNMSQKIQEVVGQKVVFKNGESRAFDIILKTYPDKNQVQWKSCDNLYFEINESNLSPDFIGLISDDSCLSNNINVHFSGQDSIMSITIVKKHSLSEEQLVNTVRKEIKDQCNIDLGKFINRFEISRALVDKKDLKHDALMDHFKVREGLYRAGDYTLNSSLNAAMLSGERAAQAIIADLS